MADLREPGSRAILIGASTYASNALEDVPAVLDTLSDLRRTLIEHCGMPRESIRVLQDSVNAQDVEREVAAEARLTPGILLVYYVGHGRPGPNGELYLAVRGTDPAPWKEDTAISYETMARQLGNQSPARAVVVILDCCYSGLALEPGGSAGRRPVMPTGPDGGLVLTSAAPEERALARKGERYTVFTGQLLTLLREGAPGLTLRDAYRHLDRTFQALELPRPTWGCIRAADDIVLIPELAVTPDTFSAKTIPLVRRGPAPALIPDAVPATIPDSSPTLSLTSLPAPTPAPGPAPPPSASPARRNRKRGIVAGAVVLAAAVILLLVFLVGPDQGGASGSAAPVKSSPAAQPAVQQAPAAVFACASGSIELIGSSLFGPVAGAAAAVYMNHCHATISVLYGDADGRNIDSAYGVTTVNAAVKSKAPQAGSMIAMYGGDTSTLGPLLKADPVGVIILSVVAHTGLYPAPGISSGELKKVFSQEGKPGEIAVGRQAGSGARGVLLEYLGGQGPRPQVSGNHCPPPATSTACTEGSNAGILRFADADANAIGYTEVEQESNGHPAGYPNVSVLSINGVAPTPANVRNGSYTFAAVANLYMPPRPSPLAESFYRYLLQYVAAHQSDGLITCSGVPKTMAADC